MKIKVLQAFHGDSILVSFKDSINVNKNILIDGGSRKTYEYKDKAKGKIKSGNLKLAVEQIKNKNDRTYAVGRSEYRGFAKYALTASRIISVFASIQLIFF